MDNTCIIATFLSGSHLKGTLNVLYCIAQKDGDKLLIRRRTYTTVAGARRAARRRGLFIRTRYVAQGWNDARRYFNVPQINYQEPNALARDMLALEGEG